MAVDMDAAFRAAVIKARDRLRRTVERHREADTPASNREAERIEEIIVSLERGLAAS